jgi:hypothetical protein
VADVDELIHDALSHYADKYYDPAKAHAYYLRIRQLKGRTPGSTIRGQAQKEAWAYAKNQITTQNKKQKTAQAVAYHKKVTRLQSTANKKMNGMVTQIQHYAQKLNSQTTAFYTNAANVGPNASTAQLKGALGTIQGQGKKLSNLNNKAKAAEQRKVLAQRRLVAKQLHAAIMAARKDYNAQKAKLASGYKSTLTTEYHNIATKVPVTSAPKKPRKSRKRSSRSSKHK